MNAYPNWGAYGASKAALHHLSRIWDEELAGEGIRVISDRSRRHGHAAARARRSRCRSLDAEAPGVAAREIADLIAAAIRGAASGRRERARSSDDPASVPSAAAGCEAARRRSSEGAMTHHARADFPTLVRGGDLVVANDAATLPASLSGIHVPTGRADRSAAGRPRFAVARRRDALHGRRVRRRRLSDADRAAAAAAACCSPATRCGSDRCVRSCRACSRIRG